VARCIGCHLERQLGPLPIEGTNSLGVQVCPKCSKDIDRSLGVLAIFGIDVLLPTEAADIPPATETKKKTQAGAE
jgi:hypothetical protein